MQYYHTKEFMSSLKKMRRHGGREAKAANDIESLLFRISNGDKDPFKPLRRTKHGETRIGHCQKYDLNDFSRLITVCYDNATIFLFCGNHTVSDKWLESNKGKVFGRNDAYQLASTNRSIPAHDGALESIPDNYSGKLLDRLPENDQNLLFRGLEFIQFKPIMDIESGTPDSAIEHATSIISDDKQRLAVYDTLVLLNSGNVDAAINRARHFAGIFKSAQEMSQNEFLEISSGTEVRRIEIGSDEYKKWLENFLHAEHPFEWFLFMHPEQEQFVQQDYPGPIKLSGVSGSGKTAVAIRRAIRLAEKYGQEQILVVTLNKALSGLISEIMDHACSDAEVRKRISVKSFFEVARDQMRKFEPEHENHYVEMTVRLEEHKDEVYREFYRCLNNNKSGEVLLPTHRLLVAQGLDAERYISEEFDWIRSVTVEKDREKYISIKRIGRGYQLLPAHREKLLSGLSAWEQKMKDVGVIDSLGLTMAVSRYIDKIKPSYRCIIVDEAQDFGTTELRIIRKLAPQNSNDIFLCGDAAQQVQAKNQNFEQAGIDVRGRSHKLTRNYRNSREILQIAYNVLLENLSEEHFENSELEISDPQYATRTSAEPIALQAESLEQEIAAAIQLVKENQDDAKERGTSHSGCVVIAGYTQFEVEEFGSEIGIPALNADQQFFGGEIFLSDLEQTKGYEFDTVVIVNCRSGVLPPTGVPREEFYRFAGQFYVAMTRAKQQLILSYSDKPSGWLTNEAVGLSFSDWGDFIDLEALRSFGEPGFLPEFPDQESDFDIYQLNGRQFGYTPWARGLDSELLERIEEQVPGQSLRRDGKRIKWENLGQLMEDYKGGAGRPRAAPFGAKSDKLVLERLIDGSLGLRPVMRRKEVTFEHDGRLIRPASVLVPVKAPTKEVFSPPQYEVVSHESIASLSELDLTSRQYAVLHGMGIRTVDELRAAKNERLSKSFTKSEISLMKKLASVHSKNGSRQKEKGQDGKKLSVDLSSIGLRERTVNELKSRGIINLQQLSNLSIRELRTAARISISDIQQLQRIAASYGVKLRD